MTRLILILSVLFLSGWLLGGIALSDDEPKELTPEARKNLEAEWEGLNNAGSKFYQNGKYSEAQKSWDSALALARRLYPKNEYPDGHWNLAESLNNQAVLLVHAKGTLTEAEPFVRDALAIRKRLARGDHPDLAKSLASLANLLELQGKQAEAETLSREALGMRMRLFKGDHADLASAILKLANLLKAQGKLADSEPLFRDALAMYKRLFKGDHPDVVLSLNGLALLLTDRGKLAEAESLYRDALAMAKRLFKGDHPYVALSLHNLALLIQAQGKLTESELYLRDALAMFQRLFKTDHPAVATFTSNLAALLYAQGKLAEAEPLCREALSMDQRLFKGDHPEKANNLNALALLLRSQGKLAEAELHSRDALAMTKRLFKGDHPYVAGGLHSLAALLRDQGKLAEAESLFRDALAMHQRLSKGDYPDLAMNLNSLAFFLQARGKPMEAEPLLREALAMYRRLLTTYARQKNEGDALNLVARQPLARDGFLMVSRQLQAEPASVYAEVWASKGSIARVFEQRQQAARAASADPRAAVLLANLTEARRQRADLILAPISKDLTTRQAREQSISALEERIAKVERDLRPLLPNITRAEKLAAASPADLQKALPADAALVDFLRYTLFEYDPQKPGKAGEKRIPSYLAFVVTKERINWVDLGPAGPIEESTAAWREGIIKPAASARDASAIPGSVRELVWAKVRDQLPALIKTVYIAPDMALCRLPWAALPGDRPGTIMLEDFTLAMVPHATYLLDQLWSPDPQPRPPVGFLVVGGVKYDADVAAQPGTLVAVRGEPLLRSDVKGSWPFLAGTLAEARGVAAQVERKKNWRTKAAPLAITMLEGDEATTAGVLDQLPKAKYAHFATHGFFADSSFRSIFQLDPKEFERSMRGERIGRAATSPLIMTGLVFAGANHPKTPGRGIVTGEALVDLDLSGLELAVLSACETGLGDVAGGEGTFGLQRAFHLAGARNVLASLWKVPDEATAALMGRFYHKLWEEGLPPMDALRQAQLEIYRRPERIAEWSKSIRGKFEVVSGSPETRPAEITPSQDGTTPPFYWAAFSLSGLGR
jgi:CHAT domain-containing protein/tetratricopeptide (TPR) repeat protein